MARSLLIVILSILSATASASIFLPSASPALSLFDADVTFHRRRSLNRALTKNRRGSTSLLSTTKDGKLSHPLAMAIPGNSMAEQIVVGGFGNFIAIYNTVITARILLSWFPQSQGIGALQPVFQITDPYLNLFRGIIPPIFGLDLSPILAFVTLNLLQSSAVSLAADLEPELKEKLMAGTKQMGGEKSLMSQQRKKFSRAVKRGRAKFATCE